MICFKKSMLMDINQKPDMKHCAAELEKLNKKK